MQYDKWYILDRSGYVVPALRYAVYADVGVTTTLFEALTILLCTGVWMVPNTLLTIQSRPIVPVQVDLLDHILDKLNRNVDDVYSDIHSIHI